MWCRSAKRLLEKAFIATSKLDGKEGLTMEDLKVVMGWVVKAAQIFPVGEGTKKSLYVAEEVLSEYSDRVDKSNITGIVWIAYKIAKLTGVIK